jgi:glycosyltransferase involved in cell wall biosynthesis
MPPLCLAHVVEATAGGVARHIHDLVTRLDPIEFTHILYVSFDRRENGAQQLRALADAGVQLRELPMQKVPNRAAEQTLAAWVAEDKVDLLHLHSAKAGFLGRRALRVMPRPLPVIYTPHAFPFQRLNDWLRYLYLLIERRLARETTRIICVSEGEAEAARSAGLPGELLTVIPNGLELARWPVPSQREREQAREAWGISPHEVVVGAMGRLVPQKGFDRLLEAGADLLPDLPYARLFIWGDGPERPALRRLARTLRLPRVTFLGGTEEPWRAYAAMDIYCAPSRWEAGPYAVLEAMACALPVVASRVAGNEDYVVDGETGLVVDASFPGELDTTLRQFINDPNARDLMGQAGRHRVADHFTVSRMVEATAAVYRAAMQEHAVR